jgi:hypothetical protein
MEKLFTGYILLNWKNGKFTVRKTQPKKSRLNPFEIPIRLEIKVEVPEQKELVAKGEITLSEEKVKEMVIEELK